MPPKPSAASSCSARIRTSTPRPTVSRAASAASHSGLLTADGVLARSLATATAPAMTAALLTCGLRVSGSLVRRRICAASAPRYRPRAARLSRAGRRCRSAVASLAGRRRVLAAQAELVTAEQRSLGERLDTGPGLDACDIGDRDLVVAAAAGQLGPRPAQSPGRAVAGAEEQNPHDAAVDRDDRLANLAGLAPRTRMRPGDRRRWPGAGSQGADRQEPRRRQRPHPGRCRRPSGLEARSLLPVRTGQMPQSAVNRAGVAG